MKKFILYALFSIVVFLFSCQKEETILSHQKVELSFYAFNESSTPVNVCWSSLSTGLVEKTLTNTTSEVFYITQDDTLRIVLTPLKENSFLNVYFKLIVNDVTVRTAKLYNDTKTSSDNVAFVYYIRSSEQYNVSFLHETNDINDAFPYLLSYSVNDSVCSNFLEYNFEANQGDIVSSKVTFRIPTSEPVKPVFHKTTITVNGEIVRYDYINRCNCGSHSSEMKVKMDPYL